MTSHGLPAAARQIRQKVNRMLPPLLGQGPYDLTPDDRDALAIAMLADQARWMAGDVPANLEDAALVRALGLSHPVPAEVVRMGATVLVLSRVMRRLLE